MRSTLPIASSSASALLFAALPKCPMCLIVLLAPFGISVSGTAPFLIYLGAMVLTIPLVLFWVPSCRRCGIWPLLLAVAGAGVMMLGRFVFDSMTALVCGAVILFVSALRIAGTPSVSRGGCGSSRSS